MFQSQCWGHQQNVPQLADEHIHRPGGEIIVVAPDAAQRSRVVHCSSPRKVTEAQVRFLGANPFGFITAGNGSEVGIEMIRSDWELLLFLPAHGFGVALEDGTDLIQQHLRVEGFGNVVVGTGTEPFNDIDFQRLRGQKNERDGRMRPLISRAMVNPSFVR